MRTHWFKSSDPPTFGESLTALCGEVVPHAQPTPAMWGPESGGLVNCRKCDRAWNPEVFGYVAVIQSGEESIER